MSQKPVYIVDGARFSTLEEFYEEITKVLNLSAEWGRNLDAFDDLLYGGFGTPPSGFVIGWVNSDLSRERLGYEETARQLKLRLDRCHPSNREVVSDDLRRAEVEEGPTVFDWLIKIIKNHSAGGAGSAGSVELFLE